MAVAFHAGLFNIGGEGQAYIGGLGCGLAILALDRYLPALADDPARRSWPRPLFGAAWAAVPAWLQAWRGSHIVITTIMFNFVAAALMVYLMVNVLIAPGSMTPQSRAFAASAQAAGDARALAAHRHRSGALAAQPVDRAGACCCCVGVWVFLWHTPLGLCAAHHGPQSRGGASMPASTCAA